MQAPRGPEEDPSENFNYGGWMFGYGDDVLMKVMGEQMGHPFELLLGRKTYDIFASYWPHQTHPPAEAFNKTKKYVASHTLKNLSWSNSQLLENDIMTEIKKLKQQNGNELQVHRSGNLVQTLLKNDLVDELWLKIFPCTLGKGKRLFDSGAIPVGWKLIHSQITPNGIIIANYKREGPVKIGSFKSLEE
jgi:dihydrofolate reductase